MKLKLLFFFLLLSLLSNSILAQSQYGNEWIKKNQSYLKVKVSESSLYKISYSQLQTLNFLSSNPNPKNFQLYYQGKEIPLIVSGE